MVRLGLHGAFACLVLFSVATSAGRCDVALRGGLSSAEGVRWAAGELSKTPRCPRVAAELASKDLGVGDGYVIEPVKNGLLLRGNSEGSIIYGLLDIRDRLKRGDAIPGKLRFTPSLRLRGLMESFPFWGGTSMYSDFWKNAFEKSETDPKSWWRDRPGWTRRFREYAERRVNSLVLNHPHPYPAVLAYDAFHEAQVYPPEQARRNADDFRWIAAEGRKYGVSIYFLTWNIVVPPSFASAHGVEEFGSQAQVVKDYTRYCVKKLFDTYPDLGGLVTMGAETPVGCTDWVIENVISAMNDCRPRPNLIWWGWCTYPEDSLKVKRAYKGQTEVMHYLQYEQFFKPMADPRMGRWSRETGGTKMIAIGGPKSAHCFYTWGDPVWAREVVRSLKEDNNGSGLILETWMSATWLAREAFCASMWSLSSQSSTTNQFRRRLSDRYSPAVAPDLLDCYVAASRIVPRFLCLVHSQSDHFQPMLGLPLVYYLGMPSLSTYVFEWYDGIDSRGRLTPNYGLSWPNPDWGEKVLTINDYAANVARGKSEFASTTPTKIADEIESSALLALGLINRLEKLKPENNAGDFAYTLKILRMNALWGLQAAWKIRAAVNWALFIEAGKGGLIGDTAGDRAEECARCLERSLEHYRKLAELASQVYPNRMHFYQSFLSTPPPWKQNDIWFSYMPVNSHWRDMLPRYEKELELVREQLMLGPKLASLPLADQLWQEPEQRMVASFDFEQDDPRIVLDGTSCYSDDPAHIVSGKRSVLCDSRGAKGEWHNILRTDPSKLKLEIGKRYQVRFRYRVIHNPNGFSQPFAAAARTDKGGWQRDLGTFRTYSGRAGSNGEHVIQFEPREFDDYYVYLFVHGPAAIAVDDLTIAEVAPNGGM